jgi:hypothetical protein
MMKRSIFLVTTLCVLGLWVNAQGPSYIQSMAAMQATTGSIGGGALLAGACTSGAVAVASSLTGNAVIVSPNTYPGDGIIWYGYVSVNGTVTVKACAILALTPTASTYNVKVIQ